MISERAKDSVLRLALLIVIVTLVVSSLTGCAAYQAIDRVKTPPTEFQGPSVAQVEFVAAWEVVPRCLYRGTGLAHACTSDGKITITNPCDYPDQPYARLLCHETSHVNGWDSQHSTPPPPLPPERVAE